MAYGHGFEVSPSWAMQRKKKGGKTKSKYLILADFLEVKALLIFLIIYRNDG